MKITLVNIYIYIIFIVWIFYHHQILLDSSTWIGLKPAELASSTTSKVPPWSEKNGGDRCSSRTSNACIGNLKIRVNHVDMSCNMSCNGHVICINSRSIFLFMFIPSPLSIHCASSKGSGNDFDSGISRLSCCFCHIRNEKKMDKEKITWQKLTGQPTPKHTPSETRVW